ncbi:hypothetical protein PLICRDRAFT_214569 [Plicaturopsis crispa FD-325 SS-3]|nr:hypothetical protein PLICRDRAFT_214569 [Plicaturopsis crispa FD-325 SS-3]
MLCHAPSDDPPTRLPVIDAYVEGARTPRPHRARVYSSGHGPRRRRPPFPSSHHLLRWTRSRAISRAFPSQYACPSLNPKARRLWSTTRRQATRRRRLVDASSACPCRSRHRITGR